MSQPNDSNKSVIPLEQDNTMIAVIEMGQASWLVAGIVPGLERQPLKKLGSDEQALFQLLQRWRNEAVQTGRTIKRLVVAYEAGRDGFWLARWLRARDIEAYVIHPNSVAVSREHRRAKTDRLDTELLKRAFLGWLRGEAGHCSMAAIPTIEEEDARRPNRERENLVGERTRIVNRMKATLARFGIRSFKFTLRHADERLNDLRTAEAASLPANTHAELRRDIARLRVVRDQIKEIEQQRLQRIEQAAPSEKGPHAMIRLLARVIGIGVETADMLVNEILSRQLRDRKAVARYAGLTGSPDESGKRRREVTAEWQADYDAWRKRDLLARRYVYVWADGVYLQVRMEEAAECMLVLIGATPEGKKELVGFQTGVRESAQSWRELLIDIKQRGLEIAPDLAAGDGALGFWKAIEQVFPSTRHQRCWVHKTANVLNKVALSVQTNMKVDLREIYGAPTRAAAEAAIDVFADKYGAKYEKAVACLTKDRDALLAFFDFPAEHWDHLRTSNPIESVFATVRHRTVRTKGALSAKTAKLMVFKLVDAAAKTWRRLKGENQLPKVIAGIKFQNGIEVIKMPAHHAAFIQPSSPNLLHSSAPSLAS